MNEASLLHGCRNGTLKISTAGTSTENMDQNFFSENHLKPQNNNQKKYFVWIDINFDMKTISNKRKLCL